MRKLSLASLAVLSALAATPAMARVDLFIGVPPPVVREEVVPPPRHGWVWAPGFWEWRHGHHMWVRGHWIREHRGHAWIADHWDRDGDRYHFVPGHWE